MKTALQIEQENYLTELEKYLDLLKMEVQNWQQLNNKLNIENQNLIQQLNDIKKEHDTELVRLQKLLNLSQQQVADMQLQNDKLLEQNNKLLEQNGQLQQLLKE